MSEPTVIFPEPPSNPPMCHGNQDRKGCGEENPDLLIPQKHPASILCRSCGVRSATRAGWIPYLRKYAISSGTQRKLDAWQGQTANRIESASTLAR